MSEPRVIEWLTCSVCGHPEFDKDKLIDHFAKNHTAVATNVGPDGDTIILVARPARGRTPMSMSKRITDADMAVGLEVAGFAFGLKCFEHITMDDVQAKVLATQVAERLVAERLRVAGLVCKDCGSGRPLSISTLSGGVPRWFHLTGPASGRECQAAVVWGPAIG